MTRSSIIASLSADAQRQVREQLQIERNVPTVKPNRSKYGNIRTPYKSIQGFERLYDSKAEANYAAQLDQEIRAKMVQWWLPQVRMPLPGGVVYVVDFMVCIHHAITFRDVKGKDTQASINKRKQVKACYGIDVEIVRKTKVA